jgi:hypothetical protein
MTNSNMHFTTDMSSRGFDAGNYAAAYEGQNHDACYEKVVAEAKSAGEPCDCEQFAAGFILGFYSSYEDDEITNENDLEKVQAAMTLLGFSSRD